jgi:beta-1,4-mannooligosaccharide/beta-1,4-mannosyl-N-acetylglucosamine phosphorylase
MVPPTPPHLEDVTSVFNPGAVKFDDRILLMLRVQNRGRETFFLMAESSDGMRFAVRPEPVRLVGIEEVPEKIYHCYDARITPLEGAYYVMFAMDMDGRCELGLARTEDFESFRFMGIVSKGDTRNGVLFPEKINGRYLCLDRPNRVKLDSGVTTGDAIVLSESDDLLDWRPVADVAAGRLHYWDELIGPGPPPIKTAEGWLLIYHGVATHLNAGIYQMGVMLLDLDDPGKIKARSRYNILEPRELYEMVGQVPNVVFPGGAIVHKNDDDGFALPESRVLVYYGAADTCVCLALTTIEDLIAAARAGPA